MINKFKKVSFNDFCCLLEVANGEIIRGNGGEYLFLNEEDFFSPFIRIIGRCLITNDGKQKSNDK